MNDAPAVVTEMLRLAEIDQNPSIQPSIQPSILLNQNIDPTKIIECTSCHVNDAREEKLRKLIEDGFIIFRIQTEFCINCHITVAYLARMRP